MKVVVGSNNPIKILATKEAFQEILSEHISILQYSPRSSVSNTPTSIDEMIRGAKERAETSMDHNLDCKFGIGIEGGLFFNSDCYFLTAYSVIVDANKNFGIGGGPAIKLPSFWEIKLSKSFEFGDYVDSLSNRTNIKQNEGAMGYLTQNTLVRKDSLKFSVLCAYYALINEIRQKKEEEK